jgi:hypothetical protein
MKALAETRTTATAASVSSALPMILAVNTFLLLAIDRLGGIPTWLKSTVALFLQF